MHPCALASTRSPVRTSLPRKTTRFASEMFCGQPPTGSAASGRAKTWDRSDPWRNAGPWDGEAQMDDEAGRHGHTHHRSSEALPAAEPFLLPPRGEDLGQQRRETESNGAKRRATAGKGRP